ncbi:gamma-glutamyl-gamma-aminobutyrate hydrolase family protein [Primorskyibacter sp. 2E233]|uniref:gamma-glutamyl-gamma-aminobutyrate hydrolase family protein n=1 Tax=Primorskyibacter sp. 2E233 TaxID=3413431 RepID=UPI003BF28E03
MTRPRIGVTTSGRSGWRIFPIVNLNLWLAGGRGVRWGAGRPADLDDVDGIIIGGGDDIAPELYGGKLGISVRLDRDRDSFERDLAETAIQQGIPVLGICRGAQMLNVALGGTLDQTAWQTFGQQEIIKTILPRRAIDITQGSVLERIVGPEEMTVNALHTQAIDKLGKGLSVVARDKAGMPQAVECSRDPFALGVQWHPEHLFYARRQRAIFRALVSAAAERAEGRAALAKSAKA